MPNARAFPLVPLLVAALSAAPALAVPPTPPGFTVDPPSACGTIRMTWGAVAGALGYEILRNGDPIARVGPQVTTYIDLDVSNPILYTYCIRSYDGTGSSPTSCGATLQTSTGLNVDPSQWFQDVFPFNVTAGLPGTAAFDTASAIITTGENLAACGGAPPRPVIPGVHCYITVPAGTVRVDLIFRIKPGPGNYTMAGATGSGLRKVPTAPAASAPGDGSFWGTYKAAPGLFSTPGAVVLHAAAPSGWDVNVWNSAQCELAAPNLYRTSLFGSGGTPILPSGILTAGTHVEYYFRVVPAAGPVLLFPDINCVTQTYTDHGDAHRWQSFSVLPDRWKDAAYGGLGNACALVVDLDDGGGDERVWRGIADSLGMTAQSRFGAAVGWHTVGLVAGEAPVDPDDPAHNYGPAGPLFPGFVDANLGQSGTTWDLYNVVGATESCRGNAGALGGRYGFVPAGQHPPGPTIGMLSAYYRMIILLTGERTADILGPIADRSQNDVFVLKSFLLGSTLGSPRALIAQGGGFAKSQDASDATLLSGFFGLDLRDPSYRALSGNTSTDVALVLLTPLTCTPDRYRLFEPSFLPDNVLDLDPGAPEALVTGEYENVGGPGPYAAAIYKPPVAARPWYALLQSWVMPQLDGWLGADSYGRLAYYYCMFNDLFGPICTLMGSPLVTLDAPGSVGNAGTLRLLGVRNNPMVAGEARVDFQVESTERLKAQVLDVAGRLVRTLADRPFERGAHTLTWDGSDASGRAVPRGLYLTRIVSSATGRMVASKITVLH